METATVLKMARDGIVNTVFGSIFMVAIGLTVYAVSTNLIVTGGTAFKNRVGIQ